MQCWRIDDDRQTIVLASRDARLPEVVYWAGRLPDGENLETLAHANAPDVTGGMLDANLTLAICPEASQSFPGQPGIVIRSHEGAQMLPSFRFHADHQSDADLRLSYRDDTFALTYTATFSIDPETHILMTQA